MARFKYRFEDFKDALMPWRAKRWNYVSAVLEAPKRGAELGVKAGRFTAHMLADNPGLHLTVVDLWSARPESAGKAGGETYAQWNFDDIRGEFDRRTARFKDRLTVLRMSTLEAAPRVEDASLDFVFIDADHSYEAVLQDIAAWEPKVRPGGWVMGHDFSEKFPGVQQAVRERFDEKDIKHGPDTVWAVLKPKG